MTINKIIKLGILTFSLIAAFAVRGEEVSPTVSCRFNNLGVQTGGTVSLPVIVDNNFAFSGWQCDITVPEGVTVTDISLNPERTSDHTGNYSVYSDHSYRYVVASMSFQGTTGETGPLFYVKLKVTSDPGDYNVTLSNFRCTDTDRENTHEYVASSYTGTLTVVGAVTDPIALVDGQPYENAIDYSNVDVTYTRNFTTTKWEALYVPFDMPYEEWSKYGSVAEVNNVHQYDDDNDGVLDRTVIEYNRVTSGRLEPNKPYVFKANNTGTVTFDCKGVTLKGAANGQITFTSARYKYTNTGIYQTKTDMKTSGAWALTSSGAFKTANSDNVTLKPYRFFLTITVRDDSGNYNEAEQAEMPKSISIQVNGEESGIEYIPIWKNEDDVWYDLLGHPVKNPSNGIFIHNNKKVIIK